METLSDLTPENAIELDNTLAWNFTVASNDAGKIREAVVMAAKYGMVVDPCEMNEVLGVNPEKLAAAFKYSARFMDVETLGHPTRLQAWEFVGEAEDRIEGLQLTHSPKMGSGANYFLALT